MSIAGVINQIASVNGLILKNFIAVSGGDISMAYRLKTSEGDLFLKLNSDQKAEQMFSAEAKGLNLLASSNAIKAPEVIAYGRELNHAYLLLEAIQISGGFEKSMSELGEQLAALHGFSSESFGLDHDNFIGSLPQSNKRHDSWTAFYVKERLAPQYKMAASKNLLNKDEIPTEESMIQKCDELFINVKPSLLHGDLWSGNYLIDHRGKPVLIDPAVYYGHHEVDIAMCRLFGGFHSAFYEAYEEIFPKTPGYEMRMDLYQLYYLLVHLNLFGRSYYGSVLNLTKKLFGL